MSAGGAPSNGFPYGSKVEFGIAAEDDGDSAGAAKVESPGAAEGNCTRWADSGRDATRQTTTHPASDAGKLRCSFTKLRITGAPATTCHHTPWGRYVPPHGAWCHGAITTRRVMARVRNYRDGPPASSSDELLAAKKAHPVVGMHCDRYYISVSK